MKRKFISVLFQNKNFVFMLAVLAIFSNIFAQLVPYFQGLIVENTLISQDMQELILLCLIIFSVLILDSVCRLFFNSFMLKYGYRTAKNIQLQIFQQILGRSYDFFEEKSRGDILYRINTYIYNVGNFISRDLADLAISIARILMIFVFLFVLESYFALFMLALYGFILVIMIIYSRIITKKAKIMKDKEIHRNAMILQNIEGLETYLAFNTSGRYLDYYSKINSSYGEVRSEYYRIFHFFIPLIDFLVCLGTVLIYIIVSTYTIHILQIGIVVAALSYVSSMIPPMESMTRGIADFVDTSVVVDEVFEYANEDFGERKKIKKRKQKKQQGKKAKQNDEKDEKNQSGSEEQCNEYLPLCCDINATAENQKIDIICENLCYKNEKSSTDIQNLNLKIKANEKVLIVGESGSGKTVFAGLLCGLYKPDSGKILFNNVEINGLSKKNLSDLISMTSDFVSIFKASVYENIKFAKPNASEKEIDNAIKFSGLKRITDTLNRGKNTAINPYYISEGDKQLISFARIILKDTPIVIVDEVSRDMGTNVRKKFMKNLKKFVKEKTLIYISEYDNVDFEFDKVIQFNKINKR
jgi:ATP-binding cassette subfamily B protein